MSRLRLPPTLAGTLAEQYPALSQQVAATVREQAAYLSRFADDVAARQLLGQPMSANAVASRSAQYGGAGRAEHYRAREVLTGEGFVSRYEARDDKATCFPCLEAEGVYLASQGPYPGTQCLGRGRCRCRRVQEYNPSEYRRLKGTD